MNKIAENRLIEKMAKEYVPGRHGRQMAASRALRLEQTGIKSLVNDPAYFKPAIKKTLKGEAIGLVSGVGAGAMIGKILKVLGKKKGKYQELATVGGALIGGLSGLSIGGGLTEHKAKKDYLKTKGVTLVKGKYNFTPEAKKKYVRPLFTRPEA